MPNNLSGNYYGDGLFEENDFIERDEDNEGFVIHRKGLDHIGGLGIEPRIRHDINKISLSNHPTIRALRRKMQEEIANIPSSFAIAAE